ncbi:MAG TPA: 4-(cytidine 5'-diphospho)-2-C-methyl-D-erythritol kinase [Burkholderiales bacterium]|nr:4-(cytidine 5'-diphospho)-2-C-methyl-D-erythritol kinase [Burkholderiales bacterium]
MSTRFRTRFPAPAKINLFLHVVGRRPDGYHLLQTVFQFVDLCDWIDIELRDDGRIVRTRALEGVGEDDDLVIRAARLLQQATGTSKGASLAVEKTIPLGGGLGGGSSNAATTLVALNHLWGTGLDLEALASLGLKLGADVPVFVHGRNAWAEGIGERLTPIDLPTSWYVLIHPGVSVQTGQIFAAPELTRHRIPLKIAPFSKGLNFDRVANDLEPVVRDKFPQVAQALDWLKTYGDARMSGSGACVYAAFGDEAEARSVMKRIPSGWQGYAVRSLERHPLHLALNSTEVSD